MIPAESEKQYQVVGFQLIMKKKHHRVPVRQAVVADLSPDGRGRMGQKLLGKDGIKSQMGMDGNNVMELDGEDGAKYHGNGWE